MEAHWVTFVPVILFQPNIFHIVVVLEVKWRRENNLALGPHWKGKCGINISIHKSSKFMDDVNS